MSKIIIIVRNKPRISLIKLVISIIPVISCKKGKSLLKSSLSEGHFFLAEGGGVGGYCYFQALQTPVKFSCYIQRVATFGGGGLFLELKHINLNAA